MPRHAGGERYLLELRPLADDDAPAVVRLRQVLKSLLRAYRFRAVSVRDVTPRPPTATPGAAQDAARASRRRDDDHA
ncbi:MAG TPA: hypothetical protein VKA46_29605 [Gemmataceae bacterium]|nr:hypothetical protein [Gemmataceae bacterium]